MYLIHHMDFIYESNKKGSLLVFELVHFFLML